MAKPRKLSHPVYLVSWVWLEPVDITVIVIWWLFRIWRKFHCACT